MANSHLKQEISTSVSTYRRSHLCSVLTALFLAGLPQITSGCAAARLTQFHNFSQAGAAYTKATQAVLDEAGTAAIEADSLIAQKGRDGLRSADERRQFIIGENQELRKRLVLLGDIGRHGRLLQSYFEALAALSEGPRHTGDGSSRRIRFHRRTESHD